MVFVNAGVTNSPKETIGEVSTEKFIRVMVTNALSPMRVVQALYDVVADEGTIGVMSSGQGSVANNTNGMREVYRGSKAALNMFMRSFAARHCADQRAMVLMALGRVRTELGGSDARFSIEESIPNVVSALQAAHGHTPAYNTWTISVGRFPGRRRQNELGIPAPALPTLNVR